MTARHLILGLDGADLSVIEGFGRKALPNLFALMDRGAFARLESVMPPATLPNWTTFLTGADPGMHGVFDFTTRTGYRVAFTAGSVRETPTIMARLDRMGLTCACVSFPGTWPPERLSKGVFISGWDSPVAFSADKSFVWPPAVYDEIVSRFGTPSFDDVDEFEADSEGWHDALPNALCNRIARKVDLGQWLMDTKNWDVFALYFGESDTAAHHLWSLHDPKSPRRPEGMASTAPSPLLPVYRALDDAVGVLTDAAGHGVEITIVSDHGSGGAGDKVLYLNRALEEAGLLTFRPQRATQTALRLAKDVALTRLPPAMRERVFRLAGSMLPGWVESEARFGGIDMGKTAAFSDELNYFPAVHLNLAGREPAGTVRPEEIPAVRRNLERALLALRDPWTGGPVVNAIHHRDEIYRGPHVSRAPDFILELALDAGYSYNLMPTASAPAGTGAWRKLGRDEYLGRKGRSLPGSHRARGTFIAAGPRVRATGEVRAKMADATATLLARANIAVPQDTSGRVMWSVLRDDVPQRDALAPQTMPNVDSTERGPQDDARVEARLRALGYID